MTLLHRRHFWAVLFGNLLEHYDTALYALLSPLFASLFFSSLGHVEGLILAYALIPLGMIVRPLGAFCFGLIGDRRGRIDALVLSMLGMGVTSLVMAFLPTEGTFKNFSPLLLLLARCLQNFCLAGENMGGAIFLLEGTSKERHDRLSSLYAMSTVIGIVIASLAVSLLYAFQWIESVWRILYLLGGSSALTAAVLRMALSGRPSKIKEKLALSRLLKEEFGTLCRLMFSSGFSYATYSASFVLINGFAPLIANVTLEEMLIWNTGLLLIDIALLPIFGWLASLFSRERVMQAAALLASFLAIPLFLFFERASLIQVIALRFVFVFLGVAFCAPWHAWAQEMVAPERRFLVISLGYSLGALCLGGPFASLSLWMYKITGSAAGSGALLSLLALLAFFAVWVPFRQLRDFRELA